MVLACAVHALCFSSLHFLSLFSCGSLGARSSYLSFIHHFFLSHFTGYFTSYFPILLLVNVSYFDLCRGVVVTILLIDKNLVKLLSEVDLYSINT